MMQDAQPHSESGFFRREENQRQVLLLGLRPEMAARLSQALGRHLQVAIVASPEEWMEGSAVGAHLIIARYPDSFQKWDLRDIIGDRPLLALADVDEECPLGDLFAAGCFHLLYRTPEGGIPNLAPVLRWQLDPASALGFLPREMQGVTTHVRRLRNPIQRREAVLEIERDLASATFSPASLGHVMVALEEATNNAMHHAFRDEAGHAKYPEGENRQLEENDFVQITWRNEGPRFRFCVTDSAGTLAPGELAEHMRRHDAGEAVSDQRGRGLFLMRALCSETIYNLSPGALTQIIVTVDSPAVISRTRPLLINKIPEVAANKFLKSLS